MMPYREDPSRSTMPATGIFVRGMTVDKRLGAIDIAHLQAIDLIDWLRSRGGKNAWAESTVCALVGNDEAIELLNDEAIELLKHGE